MFGAEGKGVTFRARGGPVSIEVSGAAGGFEHYRYRQEKDLSDRQGVDVSVEEVETADMILSDERGTQRNRTFKEKPSGKSSKLSPWSEPLLNQQSLQRLTHSGEAPAAAPYIDKLEALAIFFRSLRRYQLVAASLRAIPQARDDANGHPETDITDGLDTAGEKLALVTHQLLVTDRDRLDLIESIMRRWFPFVYRFHEQKDGRGSLELQTKDGTRVPSDAVSDGVWLALGYLVLALGPVERPVLLIDEPETGVHPAMLRRLATFFRALSSGEAFEGLDVPLPRIQLILTTHSPLLVNALEPEMIRIVQRGKDGATHVSPFPKGETIERLLEFEGPGEVWVNEGEEKLVEGPR
jgi:predicted ATPase